MTCSQSNKKNWPKFTIFLKMKKHNLSTVAFVHKWWNQKLIKSYAWNLNKCVHVENLWFTALWKAESNLFLTSHRFESKAFQDRKRKGINLFVDLIFKNFIVLKCIDKSPFYLCSWYICLYCHYIYSTNNLVLVLEMVKIWFENHHIIDSPIIFISILWKH